MSTRPEGMLAEALTICGIDPEAVAVEWDDLCQEDFLSFSGEEFSRASLACLADLFLTFPSRFVFASDELQTAFDGVVRQSPAMLQQEGAARAHEQALLAARGLADFCRFNADEESLTAFAERVEAACGFERGGMLSVEGDQGILMNPSAPDQLQYDDLSLLLALLNQSGPEVAIFLVGQDAV